MESQTFSVNVLDAVDDPAPVADTALLTRAGTPIVTADVDTPLSRTTPADTSGPVDAWTEVNGVHSNAIYPGYSFTVTPASFPLTGFLVTVTGAGANGTAGPDEATAIANGQAEIVRAFTAASGS